MEKYRVQKPPLIWSEKTWFPMKKIHQFPLVRLKCCCLPRKFRKYTNFVTFFVLRPFFKLGAWYTVKISACLLRFIRSEGSGHMVQNQACWDASCTVGLPKQWQIELGGLVRVPLCIMRLSMSDFLPCDRVVQRAYCMLYKMPNTILIMPVNQHKNISLLCKCKFRMVYFN